MSKVKFPTTAKERALQSYARDLYFAIGGLSRDQPFEVNVPPGVLWANVRRCAIEACARFDGFDHPEAMFDEVLALRGWDRLNFTYVRIAARILGAPIGNEETGS